MTARGNERKAIYRAERDRKHFLELLPLWCERFRLSVALRRFRQRLNQDKPLRKRVAEASEGLTSNVNV